MNSSGAGLLVRAQGEDRLGSRALSRTRRCLRRPIQESHVRQTPLFTDLRQRGSMGSVREAPDQMRCLPESRRSWTVGLSKFPNDSYLRRHDSVLALGLQSIGRVIPTLDPPSRWGRQGNADGLADPARCPLSPRAQHPAFPLLLEYDLDQAVLQLLAQHQDQEGLPRDKELDRIWEQPESNGRDSLPASSFLPRRPGQRHFQAG